jgi:biopolymer transport protein ExbB
LNRFGALILMIAAVAPLLGLLGTVTGMIQTFDVITEFGTSDPKLLAGGIAVALVTTELGLIVAIPCLLLGNLLSGWADGIKDDMEQGALKVINLHLQHREQPQAASARA